MQAKEAIDAKVNYVFSEIIGCYVHLNGPGYEYIEGFTTGLGADAVGGTTFDITKGQISNYYNKRCKKCMTY